MININNGHNFDDDLTAFNNSEIPNIDLGIIFNQFRILNEQLDKIDIDLRNCINAYHKYIK